MRRTLVITVCGLGLLAPAGALASGGPIPPLQGAAGLASPSWRPLHRGRRGGPDGGRARDALREAGGALRAIRGRLRRAARGARRLHDGTLGRRQHARPRAGEPQLSARAHRPARARRRAAAATGQHRPARARTRWTRSRRTAAGSTSSTTHRGATSSSTRCARYDIEHHTLIQKPVIDPREPDEAMRGQPVTRTMSPDGRWAYTLYDRSPDAPFIHALDTRNLAAACIDLPSLQGSSNVFDMKLALAGGCPARGERWHAAGAREHDHVRGARAGRRAAGQGGGAHPARLARLGRGRRRLPVGARGAAGRGRAGGRSRW